MSDLVALLERFPDKPWLYSSLSGNLSIPIDYILNHREIGWDYYRVSSRSDVTYELVQYNPDFPWSYAGLSSNPNINAGIVAAYPKHSWDYYHLSDSPGIKMQEALEYPELPWRWYKFADRPECIDVFLAAIDPEWPVESKIPEKWISTLKAACRFPPDKLSQNPALTFEFVDAHPELLWSYSDFSLYGKYCIHDVCRESSILWDYDDVIMNPNISVEDILAHPEIEWNYRRLSCKNGLTLDVVLDHPEWNWDYDLVERTTRAPMERLVQTPGINWTYEYVSGEAPWEFIKAHKDLPWNYLGLSQNRSIPYDELRMLYTTPHSRIANYIYVSNNPNISCSDIIDHPDEPWDWQYLSLGKFLQDKTTLRYRGIEYSRTVLYDLWIPVAGVVRIVVSYM